MDLDEAASPMRLSELLIHERLFTLGTRRASRSLPRIQGPALGWRHRTNLQRARRVAAHGASFGLTEIRIGMWPFVIYRSVANALGERRALELSLMGRIFNVPEALPVGADP